MRAIARNFLGNRSNNEISELFGRFVSENEQYGVCCDEMTNFKKNL